MRRSSSRAAIGTLLGLVVGCGTHPSIDQAQNAGPTTVASAVPTVRWAPQGLAPSRSFTTELARARTLPEYRAIALGDDGVRLPSPARRWDVVAGTAGTRIALPDSSVTTLRVTHIDCGHGDRALAGARFRAVENRAERDGAGVVERIATGAPGLEHTFSIDGRACGAAPSEIVIDVAFDGLTPRTVEGGARLVDAKGVERLRYTDLSAMDANGHALDVRMTTEGGLSLHVDARAAAFPVEIDPLVWIQQQELTADDGATGDRFGSCVALDGDTVVIGAYNKTVSTHAGAGTAYVYVRSGTTWSKQAEIVAPTPINNGHFGTSCALSGDTAVIGEPTTGTVWGKTHVFVRNGTTWSLQQTLQGDRTLSVAPVDLFGSAVAIEGDTAVIVASRDLTSIETCYVGGRYDGYAYVFTRTGTTWSRQTKLLMWPTAASGVTSSGNESVALSGTTLLTGVHAGQLYQTNPCASNSGYFVSGFVGSGSAWSRQQTFYTPVEPSCGGSVALDGDTAIIGCGINTDTRKAVIWTRAGTTWSIQQTLTSGDINFGQGVAIKGDTAVVGAPSGNAVYVYTRSGTTWTQQGAKLVANPAGVGLGQVVSYSLPAPGTIVAGASAATTAGLAAVFVPAGASCALNTDCPTGFCADGVCCDTACTAPCQACSAAHKVSGVDGLCGVANSSFPGSPACAPLTCNGTDTTCSSCKTDSECMSGTYCAADGTCRSQKTTSNACDLSAGADCKVANCRACASGNCIDGFCCNTSCTSKCDVCSAALGASANGTCSPASEGTALCTSPFACNGIDTSCPTSCAQHGDADCLPGFYCSKNSTCLARKTQGQACDAATTGDCLVTGCRVCQSGNCVDGHCCNSGCGACGSCASPTPGTCTKFADGTASTTGTCGMYLCDGTNATCPTSCTTGADCTTGNCSNGQCQNPLANGQACSADTQCTSTHCVDGVCCDTGCGNTCEACSAATKQSGAQSGTCGPAKSGTNPNGLCLLDTTNPCGQLAACSGSGSGVGSCAKVPNGTSCGATSCNGSNVTGQICDGQGNCTSRSDVACAPYTCQGSACTSPCSGDGDCVTGYYCSNPGSSGTCVKQAAKGLGCSSANQCATTFCSPDGVCCDSPCNGQCEACAESSSLGTCKTIAGSPRTGHQACTGSGICQGKCDGGDPTACSYPGSSTTCAPGSCSGDVANPPPGYCDTAGGCTIPGSKNCAPYTCDASTGTCMTTCVSSGDCAQGDTCNTLTGKCTGSAAVCKDDFTVQDASGQLESCTPYKCVAGGCQQQCQTAGDCASGYDCRSNQCLASTDAGAGGKPASTGGSNNGGTAPSSGGSGGVAGTAGATLVKSGDQGGCGCRIASDRGAHGWSWALAGLLGFARRRRRTKRSWRSVAPFTAFIALACTDTVTGGGNQGSGGGAGAQATGGSSALGGSSSGGGTAECSAAGAPGTGGPSMVRATLSGGTCFWIDSTEVTVEQYAAFQNSDPSTQTPECSGNTTFVPGCSTDAGSPGPNQPVTCVDWCDALAYCKSVGKRLCHGDGATNPSNAVTNEWFSACSGDGNSYPYGDTYQADTCNGTDNATTGCSGGSCALTDAGSLTGCHSTGGAFDMSGNASEWTDECTSTSATGMCAIRGGATNSDSSALRCSGSTPVGRLTVNRFVGFRCCAD